MHEKIFIVVLIYVSLIISYFDNFFIPGNNLHVFFRIMSRKMSIQVLCPFLFFYFFLNSQHFIFLFFIFYFFSFFFKFYFIFKLYIIVLVLPNIKMNPPQVYMCSPS